MDKQVVKELIQHDLTTENLSHELKGLITDENKIMTIQKDYEALKKLLSEGGDASAKAARSVYDFVATLKA